MNRLLSGTRSTMYHIICYICIMRVTIARLPIVRTKQESEPEYLGNVEPTSFGMSRRTALPRGLRVRSPGIYISVSR